MKKLKQFMKLHGIVFKFEKPVEDANGQFFEGSFSNKTLIIYKDKNWTYEDIIMIVLHELGHFLSDIYNPRLSNHNSTNTGYLNYMNEAILSPIQKKHVLKYERDAWKYGEKLAIQLELPLGKWYKEEWKKHINSLKSLKVKQI